MTLRTQPPASTTDEEGRSYGGLRADEWRVPTILEVVGPSLDWQWSAGRTLRRADAPPDHRATIAFRFRRPEPNLLSEFTELSRASDAEAAILRFARTWGVLHLCRHGLPSTHPPLPEAGRALPVCLGEDLWKAERAWSGRHASPVDERPWDAYLHEYFPVSGREDIGRWRRYVAEATAIVRVATALHQDDYGDPSDWRVLGVEAAPEEWCLKQAAARQWLSTIDGKKPDPLRVARGFVCRHVDRWTALGGLRPRVVWGAAVDLGLGGGGLFGALAAQLAFVVAKVPTLVGCSSCGALYEPTRRPRAGERRFCPSCRANGVPTRLAKADSVAYKRGELTRRRPVYNHDGNGPVRTRQTRSEP